uniref:Putative laccase 8 n=1 Tax=Flammulina velutipes TaxID=38945 RepID=V9XTV1_FLAVE|nr:putative laccase 8 [Flammulina velutipes]
MLRLMVALLGFGMGCLAVQVIGPTGELPIVNKFLAPDGINRSTVVAGGTFPGPVITGNKGDRFRLNVIDELNDNTMLQSTTIHWHGIFQHGTSYADGPSFVTQCPIAANHSFLYEFDIPDQAGTYWYHSHLSVQYCDGLRGAFIVYDGENGKNDPHRDLYDIDDETTIITLADWYHFPTPVLLTVPGAHIANSTLINGKGRFGGDPTSELAVISVKPNARYRFRIISLACDPYYTFSIDGHNLTIIEADGINVEPFTVNSLEIYAAQRYSAILKADQPVDSYWIRANPSSGQFIGFRNGVNSAVLRYVHADETVPTTLQADVVNSLHEVDLHPLESPGAPGAPVPGGADVVLNMTLGFIVETGRFTMNGEVFVPPTIPVLLQVLSGAKLAQDLLPNGSVYGLPLNSTVEINLLGGDAPGSPHPFHLHGHVFDVVKSADSEVYNYVNPPRRDTTPVALGNLTTIRFRTDNPGPWFLHCHIDFHLEGGLAVILAEDFPNISIMNPVPETWNDLCPTYYNLSLDQI